MSITLHMCDCMQQWVYACIYAKTTVGDTKKVTFRLHKTIVARC